MSQSSDKAIENAIAEIRDVANTPRDLQTLRAVRDLLISSGFAREVSNTLARHHNEPDILNEMASRLEKARFAFKDQIVERAHRHNLVSNFAIVGGAGVVGGAVVALATQSLLFPPLALVAMATGGYSAWRGSIENRRLSLEIAALNDIADVLSRHIGKMQSER